MPIYEIKPDAIAALPETSFADAGLLERGDLQRLLREQIEILSPDTLVIAEEFADWQDSKRRIDLLGIDRDAKLVVIELKRTEDGGHMELQALRYAAMVSTMTFERAVSVYERHSGMDSEGAQAALLEFLGWDEPDEERFAQDVRIVLASAEFSKELTTAVLWLNERDLDIRCVPLRPYRDGARILLDVAQVLPLPEAEDYQVRLREKETRERAAHRPALSPEQYFAELASEGADESTARTLTEWAKEQGLYLRWPRGTQRRSVRGLLRFGPALDRYSLMILRTSGILVIQPNLLSKKPALANGTLLSAYLDALAAIPGIQLDRSGKGPRFSIECLRNPLAMKQFQAAMGGLIDGIKSWYAAKGVAPSTASLDTDDED